jgi:tetratricopeptide (TPR) repeat protein
VPIDREATLKQAEKLLRQGKLDGAIAEYVRLIEDQPRDWNSINALGDLYVRAGDLDRAVAQFIQVADHLFGEGFLPKAAALYKKALKIQAGHEHTVLRLSEIAARQGLLADARMYLRQLGRQRRDRGDTRGAAECLVRLALLDEADADAKLAGARASQALGDTPQATGLFKQAAEEFAKAGRRPETLEALMEAAALDPADSELRRHLVRECVATGQVDRAREYLTTETAGSDPDLLLALGRIELAAGNEAQARAVFTSIISMAPDRADEVLQLAGEFGRAGDPDRAFLCSEVVVDDALSRADWDRALSVLRGFLTHGAHIPALMKLVELAVDAGRDDVMYEAQAQLADACLAAGRGAEARVIAEDLVVRDPGSDAHADRLRRALDLLGISDAESVINRLREGDGAIAGAFNLDVTSPDAGSSTEFRAPEPAPVVAQASAPPPAIASPAADIVPIEIESAMLPDDAILLDTLEIDLSDALAGLGATSPMLPPPPVVPSEEPVKAPQDLETVFEEMRSRVAMDQRGVDPSVQYERGLQHLEAGRVPDALADLQAAARTPSFRFRASARLGRLHVARGDFDEGIEWLERAAEAPPPSPDEGLSVLYDLAGTLERVGETARALAILLEIDSDRSAYRDVRERIDQLTRVQAGSREA